MAVNRIRSIRPAFFEDEKVGLVSQQARLFFIGLWCRMDRNGLAEHRSKLLRMEIFPYDENFKDKDTDRLIDELCRYKAPDGELYWPMLAKVRLGRKKLLWAPKFKSNQTPHKTEKKLFDVDLDRLSYVFESIVERGTSVDDLQEYTRAQHEELRAQPGNNSTCTGLNGLLVQVGGIWVMC